MPIKSEIILGCEKCGKFTKHIFVDHGAMFRENVLFRERACDNADVVVPYSGYQTGDIYRCNKCGWLRLQNPTTNLNIPENINWELYKAKYGGKALLQTAQKRFQDKKTAA